MASRMSLARKSKDLWLRAWPSVTGHLHPGTSHAQPPETGLMGR